MCVVIQLQVSFMHALEGRQQDGDLRQACRIDHVIAVDLGKSWMIGIGDIDQCHGEVAATHGGVKIQSFEAFFELSLQFRIPGLT